MLQFKRHLARPKGANSCPHFQVRRGRDYDKDDNCQGISRPHSFQSSPPCRKSSGFRLRRVFLVLSSSSVNGQSRTSPAEYGVNLENSKYSAIDLVSRGREGSHFGGPKRASYRAAESRSFVGMLISAPPKTRLARRGRWGWPPAATVALTSEPSIERT
jgi:hypothetical protein